MSSIGIMITSKCDFTCDHCMFTCHRGGKHMDCDTIAYIQNFIAQNNICDINIYGGEPFLDMEHFRNCAYAFYEPEMSFFIATNGSFLAHRKRFDDVLDWCYKRFRWNTGEASGIRISNDIFHDECRTQKQKLALRSFGYRHKNFEEEIGWHPYENLEANPFSWAEPRQHTSEYIFDIEEPCGSYAPGCQYRCVNPSGRALKTGVYIGHKKEIYCVMSHDWKDNPDYDVVDDYRPVQINIDGGIELCSFCRSGTVGNIKDYSTMAQIEKDIEALSRDFQGRGYNISSQAVRCNACRKVKSGIIY